MYLNAKVQTARISDFRDAIELDIVDKDVTRPMGGRPQYKVKVQYGWPGVEEMRQKRREVEKGKAMQQELEDLAAQIQLPGEDDVIPLVILDITGKGSFRQLIAGVAAATP